MTEPKKKGEPKELLRHEIEDLESPDYDPPENERVWYRHARRGDRGYLAKREGMEVIRLDRPNDPTAWVQFKAQEWKLDKESRPLTRQDAVQVAFEADRRLLRALGYHRESKVEWIDLPDAKRMAWIQQGPKKPKIRALLYKSIILALKPISE